MELPFIALIALSSVAAVEALCGDGKLVPAIVFELFGDYTVVSLA